MNKTIKFAIVLVALSSLGALAASKPEDEALMNLANGHYSCEIQEFCAADAYTNRDRLTLEEGKKGLENLGITCAQLAKNIADDEFLGMLLDQALEAYLDGGQTCLAEKYSD